MDRPSYEDLLERHFNLSSIDKEHVYKEIKLITFFHADKSQQFLHEYAKQIKAKEPQVPATYFFSMFGLTVSSFLAMLALKKVVVPISLETISAQLYRNETYKINTIALRLHSNDWKVGDGSREWRRQEISLLFTSTVTPLLDCISDQVQIRPRELWGQLLNGLEYGKTIAIQLAETADERQAINDDFHWLTKQASHDLFNSLKNRLDFPLKEIENPSVPGQMQRMKATCCLYYQTEGSKGKCYTCPRMSVKEREIRKKEIVAEVTQ